MMNKHIFYYLMVGSMALLLGACNDSMNDLLEPKVYFESKENKTIRGFGGIEKYYSK